MLDYLFIFFFLLILNCQERHQNSVCKNVLNVFFPPQSLSLSVLLLPDLIVSS